MKLTNFQNYLWVLFLTSIIISALLAHIGIPVIAILGGFVLSSAVIRFFGKKWWSEASELSEKKKWILSGITALIGSQMGWVALLI